MLPRTVISTMLQIMKFLLVQLQEFFTGRDITEAFSGILLQVVISEFTISMLTIMISATTL